MTNDERREMRAIVHDELRAAASIKKNGDTVPNWVFSKLFTIDRMLMIVVLGFTVGGKTVSLTSDTALAMKQAAAATDVTRMLNARVEMLSEQIAQTAETADRIDQTKATRADVSALEERLRVTVTRGELHDTVQKEILPRLVRIEQKVQ